jgi:uncharacterized membrane protein YgdD (TMEM256/DUF423 family)
MRGWFVTAAILGGAAVAMGAIGAHALKDLPPVSREAFNTASAFQMYHALAIGLAALMMRHSPAWASRAAMAFLAGIILFSGSLYLWALGGQHVLVFMPPLGGLSFIIGWGLLAVAGWQQEER